MVWLCVVTSFIEFTIVSEPVAKTILHIYATLPPRICVTWKLSAALFTIFPPFYLPCRCETLFTKPKHPNVFIRYNVKSFFSTILYCVYPGVWYFLMPSFYIVYYVDGIASVFFTKKLYKMQRAGCHDEYSVFVVDVVAFLTSTSYLTTHSI